MTTQSGINHVQATAATIDALPGPAFMTGGVAAGDFDGDGLVDLVFTRMNDLDVFYRNLGGGQFEQRTTAAGFSTPTFTNGIVSGDIDNDGDLDLYMTTTDQTRFHLYLNDGTGVFTDAGAGRTVASSNGVQKFGQGASFGDYDNDGYLDLSVAVWRGDLNDPQSRLFRNLGATQPGHFEDATSASGTNVNRPSLNEWRFQPRFVDLDRDGHLDLPIASDFMTSQIFWSDGDGTFTDGTLPAGVGTDRNGMGSTFGDYDGDGDLDWFITNITNAPENPGANGGWNRLYRNDGNRQFTDVTEEAGVRDSRWAWGTTFLDYDNDGDLDLIATNGWNGTGWDDDRTTLWRNDDGVFTDVSDSLGITDTLQGRGLAHLDYDGDGDLDVVVVNNEAAPILYRNDSNANHYLRLDLEGTVSNRDGIGAWITVTPDLTSPDEKMVWEVDGGSSFLSQNERIAHFGLGSSSDLVDLVEIEWTSGITQQLFDVAPNQTLTVVEVADWNAADFNFSGQVDGLDYLTWQQGGSLNPLSASERALWEANYAAALSASAATVPEPAGVALLLMGAVSVFGRRSEWRIKRSACVFPENDGWGWHRTNRKRRGF